MNAQSPIIEKVRKLLALSRGVANEHEAARAAEKVRQLLERHNLSLLDVQERPQTDEEVVTVRLRTPTYQILLAQAAATLLDCEMIRIHDYIPARGRQRARTIAARLHFCGLPENARASALLFEYLRDQVDGLADRHPIALALGYAAKCSYKIGLASGVEQRVERMKTVAVAESASSKALVHVGSALARRHIEKKYPDSKKRTTMVLPALWGAFMQGERDSDQINIPDQKKKLAAGGAA